VIQLRADCLVLQTSSGEAIPCAAQQVAVELVGETAYHLDPELIQHAAEAVLHYFKHDLGRATVSVGEFSEALERVLHSFGMSVKAYEGLSATRRVAELDLRLLLDVASQGLELAFFPGLRAELRQQLKAAPQVLHFKGLRECVKLLVGTKRWNEQCRQLSDQIVGYLRHCLKREAGGSRCALIVR
jgi:hypothetical protein